MTRAEWLETFARTAASSSATLDLGRTKVYVIETDERVCNDSTGYNSDSTLRFNGVLCICDSLCRRLDKAPHTVD